MNKKRRKELRIIVNDLHSTLNSLTTIKEDEDYSRDNTPENLQGKEDYEHSENCSDKMDDAISDIENAINTLENLE